MALRVGIVGLRGIGTTHAKAHDADPLSQIVACCDVIKERADTVAEQYGAKSYGSLTEMLANEDLDVVDVTTGGLENGSWHFEPAMEALEAGKNVLVEKPISHDINEARQMVAKAAEKKVYLGCNLNHYFTEPAQKGMDYIKNGQVGELVYCLHKMGFNGGEETYSPNPPRWNFPYSHLKAFLAHPFAVMRYFCGDITHVQAFLERPASRRKASDPMLSIASVHVRFQNGGIGYLLSQRGDANFGLGGWWSYEHSGTRGAFCIENCVEKITYWPGPTKDTNAAMGTAGGIEVTNTGVTDFGATFPNRIHAYLEDVTNKVPLEELRASGRDALATLEYTFAAIESYEQGGALVRPHALPPLHGSPFTLKG